MEVCAPRLTPESPGPRDASSNSHLLEFTPWYRRFCGVWGCPLNPQGEVRATVAPTLLFRRSLAPGKTVSCIRTCRQTCDKVRPTGQMAQPQAGLGRRAQPPGILTTIPMSHRSPNHPAKPLSCCLRPLSFGSSVTRR